MPRLSAGFLLYRWDGLGRSDELDRSEPNRPLSVLLVHPGGPFWRHRDAGAWSIPKGEYPPGTDPEKAAEREFQEELGRSVPEGDRIDLGTVRQAGGKLVQAWAIRAQTFTLEAVVSNHFEMEWPPKSGRLQSFPEIDRAEWMTEVRARTRLVTAQVEFLDRLDTALR